MNNLLFENKTYTIIGLCMEIHKILGHGFSEIVYKDALMLEAKIKKEYLLKEKRNLRLNINKQYCHILFLQILFSLMI